MSTTFSLGETLRLLRFSKDTLKAAFVEERVLLTQFYAFEALFPCS